jgi:uncharacterized membrane protein YbhN (UPF0104 family)
MKAQPETGAETAPTPEPPAPDLGRLGRRLLAPAVLGLLALVGLALLADARRLAGRLWEFDLALLGPVLALSLLNYALRFWRWRLYLEALAVELPAGRSLGIFLVGFLLSVTPGKAGELGKAWLVRELGGGPARRAVPAVLAERLTDVLGVVLLLSAGALAFPGGGWIAGAGVALVVGSTALLGGRRAAEALFRRAERLPRIGGRVHHLHELYERLRRLISPRLLAAGLALSTVAWGAEAVGFHLVVASYAPGAGFLASLFDYAAASVAGGLSMLPGGLLASEGSLTALLGSQGLDAATAASATLITRAATLWFAVALGLAALPGVLRRLRRAPAANRGAPAAAGRAPRR